MDENTDRVKVIYLSEHMKLKGLEGIYDIEENISSDKTQEVNNGQKC